jgi:uncharacterized protein
MRQVIVDAGPLAAYLNVQDAWHDWATEQFENLEPPLITCEPVLTEVSFLIQRSGGNPWQIVESLRGGVLKIEFHISNETRAIESLMRRYADVPMSLADACLVRLSEIHDNCRMLTTDRHFKLYRRNGRQVIPLIFPD